MQRHPTTMVILFISTVAGFGVALMAGSPVVAFALLLLGFVLAFVMATAYARPPSYPPEHHPKIDKLFDDTAP